MLMNKVAIDSNYVTVTVEYRGGPRDLKITKNQLDTILEAGVNIIGLYPYRDQLLARGRGSKPEKVGTQLLATGYQTGSKTIQPLIHNLLGFKPLEMADVLDFRNEDYIPEVVEAPEVVPEPEIVVEEVDPPTGYGPKLHDYPDFEIDANPVLGVSWNKRKGQFEAKATYSEFKDRRSLGYYKPEHVSYANAAVKRWKEEGPDSYKAIMDIYYNLYPDRAKYRK